MPENLIRKIIRNHLTSSAKLIPGEEIYIKIDQTLTHDITGVMSYLAFEALNLPRVRTECSVSYLDHNLLYVDNKTPDDHIFLQSIAKKYGLYLSRPGNGICHSVHYSRFGIPGKTLLGTDSHTPTSGAIGMLAIGAGGMDVAVAMAGFPMRLKMPAVVRVNLINRLRPGCSAKDVALEMLRRFTVKGGLGKAFEYTGEGVKTLEVPERGTIANMGAEMGATTSIFPADEVVRRFFAAQGREKDFVPLSADEGCGYDEEITLDLSKIEPLVACPDMPDNVKTIREVHDIPVQQVYIGSCTNASYADIKKAAVILKGRTVNENVSLTVSVATRQTFRQLLKEGIITDLVDSGARITEIACGACPGIGQAPPTGGVSVRTSNRNFRGRGGTADAKLFLVSPEVAAATAITGFITDPVDILGDLSGLGEIREPANYPIDDTMIIAPPADSSSVEIIRGPNIKPLPVNTPPAETIKAKISLKAGDNISTDDITPGSAQFSSMRSNIPLIAQYAFNRYDPSFVARAKEFGTSIIVGGENYGQGSSREHAAICPMFLGVKAIVAKSMARIHKNNLINHGVIPLLFQNPADYDGLSLGDELEIDDSANQIRGRKVIVRNLTKGTAFEARLDLSDVEIEIVLSGGQLSYIKNRKGA
ncbi:aconitate hydratase [Caproiciproducens sp. NJN-50]|uniref:aconitate hydratase n=1 Tax=Acutalibacteraceae TaxID=3082771 RepID=UPI000FFE0DE4|nr:MULTISPECIES: aconitate hydratase [Acutalibacteraceae]QAT49249.1 aconitate hydratase [Caproiciproducens sp. NJN-50]